MEGERKEGAVGGNWEGRGEKFEWLSFVVLDRERGREWDTGVGFGRDNGAGE